MNNSTNFYFQTPINKVEDVYRIFASPEKYIFRGQKDYSWGLTTSFERAVKIINNANWGELEQKIILEFKRRAHHYVRDIPQSEVEWLALMQHHGSPTRLLDFTRSFMVALFFAVENTNSDSAVWAIDTSYFIARPGPEWKDYLLSSYCKEAEDEVGRIITTQKQESGLIFVEPFRQNQRLAIQKGVFAFPKNIVRGFEKNMEEHLKLFQLHNNIDIPRVAVQKIVIPQKYHLEIIALLDKMNINNTTLFPGLDGYAKSQITHIKMAQYSEGILDEALKRAMDSFVSSCSSESSSSESSSSSSEPEDNE